MSRARKKSLIRKKSKSKIFNRKKIEKPKKGVVLIINMNVYFLLG